MTIRGRDVDGWWGAVLDAPDPTALAQFYSDLLGWEISSREPDWVTMKPPGGVTYLGIHGNAAYEPPTWPSRAGLPQQQAHLDIEVSDLDGAVEDAIALGARLAQFQPQDDVRVLLDPVGHPFCLYLDPQLRADR